MTLEQYTLLATEKRLTNPKNEGTKHRNNLFIIDKIVKGRSSATHWTG